MLVDNITLTIKAGNGGDGAATLLHDGRRAKGGPNGGNGGNGGDVYVQGSTNITDLRQFRFQKKIKGQDGVDGKKNNLYGKNAEHITVLLPMGTQITDETTKETIEIVDDKPVCIAKGGKGGRGNTEFKTATNQTPTYAEPGGEGQERVLFLKLRIIADIGLIGLPNAGKSSLLKALTNANPKIGDYPFTTLEPNIGMMGKYALADIPGLIEGASEGKGLGISFLQHIEKTRILVHCISCIEKDPLIAYKTVRSEFEKYNTDLLKKPEIVVLTKTDLDTEENVKEYEKIFKKLKIQVLTSSINDPESIKKVRDVLKEKVR